MNSANTATQHPLSQMNFDHMSGSHPSMSQQFQQQPQLSHLGNVSASQTLNQSSNAHAQYVQPQAAHMQSQQPSPAGQQSALQQQQHQHQQQQLQQQQQSERQQEQQHHHQQHLHQHMLQQQQQQQQAASQMQQSEQQQKAQAPSAPSQQQQQHPGPILTQSQPQLMSMQFRQAAQPALTQNASLVQANRPTEMSPSVAMQAAQQQRSQPMSHQRSISLGMHLHQLAAQSMPQQSMSTSADSLQAFGWPPSPSSALNGMVGSAAAASAASAFGQAHQRVESQPAPQQTPLPMHSVQLNAPGLSSAQAQAQMHAHQQQQQQQQQQPPLQSSTPAQHIEPEQSNPSGTINQIGNLLDDVVVLANNARELFRQGEHQVSSSCLGDLQKNLHRIGELGNQSLATVQAAVGMTVSESANAAAGQHQEERQQREQDMQTITQMQVAQALPQHMQLQAHHQNQQRPTETPGTDEAGGARASPVARKRPIQQDSDVTELPLKSLRSENVTPVHPPSAPPSAPPTVSGPAAAAMLQFHAPMPSQSAPPLPVSTSIASAPQLSALPNMANSLQPSLMPHPSQAPPNGVHSLNVSPVTPQTPFEFPQPQSQSMLGGGSSGMAHSMPSSPSLHQSGHVRNGSLHDAMQMTPTGSSNSLNGSEGLHERPQLPGKIPRSALQMSTLSSANASGDQSAVDSGASTPEDSYSNDDSGDEGNDSNESFQRTLTKHRRHRSSGPFSSGASFDFNALEESADASAGGGDKSAGSASISTELRSKLEGIFHSFLTNVCSDLEATDDRGELLHQTLMPKKMARLDESPDFRPFKFRIQAFTNAFQAEVYRNGITEAECSIKKIKQYLWTQPYISRFNEDGKKAKSKGNHIWIVEAKKIPEGGWEFREFNRKIAGAPEKIAYVGLKWTWPLKVWDPQASSTSIKAVFSCNKVPSWISWEDGNRVLSGTPTAGSESGEVSVTAHYVHSGQLHQLQHSFYLQVASLAADDLQVANAAGASAGGPAAIAPSQPSIESDGSSAANNVALPGQMVGALPNLMPSTALPPPGHAFINGNPPANFPGESINHQIVDPAKVPAVLNAISFPFTPPVHTDARSQYFHPMGMESALLTPQLSQSEVASAGGPGMEMPKSDSQMSSAVQSPMVPQGVSSGNHFQLHGQQVHQPQLNSAAGHPLQQVQQAFEQSQTTPHMPTHPSQQNQQQQQMMAQQLAGVTGEDIQAHQVRSMIERKQQAQTSSFMLSIPSRKPALGAESIQSIPGQSTPMSSMPAEMAAQLPALSSMPPHQPQASALAPTAAGGEASLSPAVNLGFDGLGEQGLRLRLDTEPQQSQGALQQRQQLQQAHAQQSQLTQSSSQQQQQQQQ